MQRTGILAVSGLVAGAVTAVSLGGGPGAASTVLAEFAFTGAAQSFTVPTGVDCVRIDAFGAQGGEGANPDGRQAPGGLGGRATAELRVTAGEVLQVNVGGAGVGRVGGFNGGADGGDADEDDGGGGGGASDVRRVPYGLSDRLVVAGGGGGGGGDASSQADGGAGGGFVGQDGADSRNDTPGGGGATQTAGGTAPASFDPTAEPGTLGAGGRGGIGPSNDDAGGGGGGGYYGGGGGAGEDDDVPTDDGAGGGGGSGFGPAGVTFETGVQTGDGSVTISQCAAGSSFVGVVPSRVFETRSGKSTVDGEQQGVGRRPAGGVAEVQVGGRAGVPADAEAVVVNVTAIRPDASGYVTVFPCGAARPDASTLNHVPQAVVANGATIKLGAGGRICVYTDSATDLIVDVTGFFPSLDPAP